MTLSERNEAIEDLTDELTPLCAVFEGAAASVADSKTTLDAMIDNSESGQDVIDKRDTYNTNLAALADAKAAVVAKANAIITHATAMLAE